VEKPTPQKQNPPWKGGPYPPSFWSKLGEEKTHAIMRGKSGNERIETLFREVQGIPVHRDIVQAVAQQKDYMKRLRKNGGARDALAGEGIAILSGNYDNLLIARLGLERTGRDEFISFKPTSADDITMLRKADKIA
jgi:Restriction endonuclease NaeI